MVKSSRFGKVKPSQRTQSCAKCKLNYKTSWCFWVIGAGFVCGKLDRKVNDCPTNKKKESLSPRWLTYAKVYTIIVKDFKASKSVDEYIIQVSNKNVKVLFDPGSNLSFVS